ncbi:MAG TPA: G8 domain-containing protein [Pirellulales bacterium]|nr:G8 domain-containing protein [Pirellulales bacterium]
MRNRKRRVSLQTLEARALFAAAAVAVAIPDFGANPTDFTIASGEWSNPAVWSTGKSPGTGDVVDISAGTRIHYAVNSGAALNTVAVVPGGELDFATDASTRFVVGNFLVMEGGTLTIGTPANPVAPNVRAEVDFAGSLDAATDPQQYGPETVIVTDFNGVAGDDFQVYYTQQAASFVLPQSTYRNGSIFLVGAPVAGLTNAQALSQYGVCAAGQIAPASAHTRAAIIGLVN